MTKIGVGLNQSISQSISTYLVPRLHKSGPTKHYKCHHSTRIVKTSAGPGEHQKKFGTCYLFLQPLKLATKKLVLNMSSSLPCQTQVLRPN